MVYPERSEGHNLETIMESRLDPVVRTLQDESASLNA